MTVVRKICLGVILTVAISLAIVLLVPSPVMQATTCLIDAGREVPLSISDLSAFPQSMIDEANALAAELFGHDREKFSDFINQLLATYLVAKDKDVVIIFNSGGLGWTTVADTREGESFIAGIEPELASMGLNPVFLNHKRTVNTFNSLAGEFMLAFGLYPPKSRDLAARVTFITDHLPNIRVILAGLSNGTVICDDVMKILKNNPRVYSIQLGPPFWNGVTSSDRSLVIRSNGTVPDSFSQGDLLAIIRANIETLLGLSQKYPGGILLYVAAPGHDYNWEYPGVQSQIIAFLQANYK